MPIANIPQPKLLAVTPALSLWQFEKVIRAALEWYRDPEAVYLVDGIREPYSLEKLERMYRYLNAHGELYYIELLRTGPLPPHRGRDLLPGGDTPGDRRSCLPGKGHWKKRSSSVDRRGHALGFDPLGIQEIYSWNHASRRCFESQGFRPVEATPRGHRYAISLTA